MNNLLIVIPATKKNAVIPDQLIKKLDGVSLIQRAINTILEITSNKKQILIITDSDEISLIAQRNNIAYKKDQSLSLSSENIIQEVINRTIEFSQQNILLFRGNTPLLGSDILKSAYSKFLELENNLLVSVKQETQNIYTIEDNKLEGIETQNLCEEIGGFYIFNKYSINEARFTRTPYIIPDEQSIEISNYQSWWVCEKILQRRRIVFNVFGSVEIGMGHIYHSLSLAHDITDHEIVFICDERYELALNKIASMAYKVVTSKNVESSILDLNPDMVLIYALTSSEAIVDEFFFGASE